MNKVGGSPAWLPYPHQGDHIGSPLCIIPMAETLRLRVVTPEHQLLDEEVDEVTAPGTVGEFGVLPNHVTFLSSLQSGRLTYKQRGQLHTLAVSGGFAEVVNNVMTVLADSAEFADEIDVERARVALRQ